MPTEVGARRWGDPPRAEARGILESHAEQLTHASVRLGRQRRGASVLQPVNMAEPGDECPDGRWWEPYLGVLVSAAVTGALLLVILLLNASEIMRVLRASGF